MTDILDVFEGLPERLLQLIEQGALATAEAELEQLLQQHPQVAILWQVRGDLCLRQAQNEAALLAYEQSLMLNPRAPEVHACLGRLLLKEKALNQALHHFEAARAFAPELPEHALALVEFYLLLGDRTQALSFLKEALSLAPSSAQAFALLGRTLYLYGRWPEAQAALKQSLELDPACELAALALLQLSLKKQAYATALQIHLHWQAPVHSPHLADLLYLQGFCQYWQGDQPGARQLWYQALEQGSEAALLPLTIAAPLVSPDTEARHNWQELARQGLELLNDKVFEHRDQALEWPLWANLPEAGAGMLVQLGQRFQAQVPAVPELKIQAQEVFRIGLIVSDLDDPALQDWALQLLTHQAHQSLEWQLFYLHPGELPAALQAWAGQCFQVPDHGEALCRLLLDFQLSALLYLDLRLSLYYLALRSPAPLQMLLPTWPVASGLQALPWASERLGTECLLARPRACAVANRTDWDLPRLAHLYLCPLPPHDWLPELDACLLELLNRDRKAFVLGLQQTGTALHTRVMQRQSETLGDRSHRVKWLDLPAARLPELIGLVDLVFEPGEAGHPWVCFQALAAGIPVLACPGHNPGSRLSPYWLAQMGLSELIVRDPALLAASATEWVTDRSRRAILKERLLVGYEPLLAQADAVSRLETGLYKEIMRLSHDNT